MPQDISLHGRGTAVYSAVQRHGGYDHRDRRPRRSNTASVTNPNDGGFNGGAGGGDGGGTGVGWGGGGASDVRQGGHSLQDRIVIAAGGGEESSGGPGCAGLGGNGGGHHGGAGGSGGRCACDGGGGYYGGGGGGSAYEINAGGGGGGSGYVDPSAYAGGGKGRAVTVGCSRPISESSEVCRCAGEYGAAWKVGASSRPDAYTQQT